MEKRISHDTFMSAKYIAQASNRFYTKRDSLKKQINNLTKEYQKYDEQIAAYEAGIKQFTGLRVEDMVKKVTEPVVREGIPVLDKNGKPVKVTKYVPTDNVSYDKETHEYVVNVPDTLSEYNEQPKHPSATHVDVLLSETLPLQ